MKVIFKWRGGTYWEGELYSWEAFQEVDIPYEALKGLSDWEKAPEPPSEEEPIDERPARRARKK